MNAQKLPTVIATSVVRSSHKGQSHGGVYLVNLHTGDTKQVIDWNDGSIDWEGRGGERGLRGIAFYNGHVYLAASREILIYDRDFNPVGKLTNPYLKYCHEICIVDDTLYITSTGFDAVIEYDLKANCFTVGHSVRYGRFAQWRRSRGHNPKPTCSRFDPTRPNQQPDADTTHLNNVHVEDGKLFASGGKMTYLMQLSPGKPVPYASLPKITHNAQPYKGGVLLNYTGKEYVCTMDLQGNMQQATEVPSYKESELTHTDLPTDHARQAFGRGMVMHEKDTLIGGSSPATISVYNMEDWTLQKQVNLTKDVRNAIHGLEIWPYAEAA